MKLYVYGSRGSVPTPSIDGTKKSMTCKYGGNTTCYMIEASDKTLHVIDGGTGIRVLGDDLMAVNYHGNINIYFTHTHWDHIQGFPFFAPAYIKGNTVNVYGEAKVGGDLVDALRKSPDAGYSAVPMTFKINGDGIKDVLKEQQRFRNFPAPLEIMSGLGEFIDFIPGGMIYESGTLKIETEPVNHPGGCVSYKFMEKNSGKSITIATDFEPDNGSLDERLSKWFEGSNIVVADGQYERGSITNPFRETFGHSDFESDIDLCKRSGVKKLILTHHEPKMNDLYHTDLEERAKDLGQRNGVDVQLARESMVYEI